MYPNPSCGALAQVAAAVLAVPLMLAAPAAVHAGEIMDALSPQARDDVDRIVRYSVAYESCRADWELDEAEIDGFVARLSQALKELPYYSSLDRDGRKVLLFNLLLEMQMEAQSVPAPDCSVVRVGGKRV